MCVCVCVYRHGNPLQYSGLENPMDWGASPLTAHRVTKNQTWLKQHMHACVYIYIMYSSCTMYVKWQIALPVKCLLNWSISHHFNYQNLLLAITNYFSWISVTDILLSLEKDLLRMTVFAGKTFPIIRISSNFKHTSQIHPRVLPLPTCLALSGGNLSLTPVFLNSSSSFITVLSGTS